MKLGLIALALCSCYRVTPPAAPARDEVRAALYAGIYGINQGLKACQTWGVALALQENATMASEVAELCGSEGETASRHAAHAKLALDKWGPSTMATIGCDAKALDKMYLGIERGLLLAQIPDDVTDGHLRIRWLARMCAEEM